MARYIDADALKLDIDLSKGATVVDMALSVIKAVQEAPTADVVPRAEVQEIVLRKMKDRCHACISAEAKRIDREHAKSEVAREIFEEIEKGIDNYLYESEIQAVTPLFAELKKKYTEEAGNENNS